ncbi:MAG: hypothetical protein O7G84_01130 [Gammaproteobacteria bacterium]|nr:hypothetical protein [Gammaproteobacteria bacterium]
MAPVEHIHYGVGMEHEITRHRRTGGSANPAIRITAKPKVDGHCHEYEFNMLPMRIGDGTMTPKVFACILFQDGIPAEVGINGTTEEALIAILIDRLERFNKGPYACRQNSLAITSLETAMHWLGDRTAERSEHGVEGTMAP